MGTALAAGRNRVPRPAAGITAFVTFARGAGVPGGSPGAGEGTSVFYHPERAIPVRVRYTWHSNGESANASRAEEGLERMPTYEYACKSCGEHVEVVQSFKDEPLTECPACGGPLRKVFGSIGIAFKGSGFYKTDSRAAAGGGRDRGGAGEGKSEAAGGGSGESGDGAASKSSAGRRSRGRPRARGRPRGQGRMRRGRGRVRRGRGRVASGSGVGVGCVGVGSAGHLRRQVGGLLARSPAAGTRTRRGSLIARLRMASAEIAVIGGSGFYRWLDGAEEVTPSTPYGPAIGSHLGGHRRRARRGLRGPARRPPRGAARTPSTPGPTCGRSASWACAGSSARARWARCGPTSGPGDLLVLDQLIDRTWGRADTYLEGEVVEHVSFADPYCPELRAALSGGAGMAGASGGGRLGVARLSRGAGRRAPRGRRSASGVRAGSGGGAAPSTIGGRWWSSRAPASRPGPSPAGTRRPGWTSST